MLKRMRDVLHSPDRSRGLVYLNLVLVVAFVLVAIIELTRTWFGAMHITDNLAAVNTQARAIARNTTQVQRLDRTVSLTNQIRQQTQPLPRQANQVEATVTDINAQAQHIQATAGDVDHGVRDATTAAEHINATVAQVLATVRSIEGDAGSIQGNATGINHSFAALLPVAQMINDGPMPFGVQNIDRNVDTVITLSHGLDGDLENILAEVNDVDHQATSICHALLVSGPGC